MSMEGGKLEGWELAAGRGRCVAVSPETRRQRMHNTGASLPTESAAPQLCPHSPTYARHSVRRPVEAILVTVSKSSSRLACRGSGSSRVGREGQRL